MVYSLAVFLKRYVEEFANLLNSVAGSIERDIGSRVDDLWVLRKEVDYSDILFLSDKVVDFISEIPSKNLFIIGVDGSSRAIDTPYAFIGLATLSIYSNMFRELLDHPPLPIKYALPPLDTPFIALSPDLPEEFIENISFNMARTPYVTLHSPADTLYTRDYNKSVILNELRNNLENHGLEHLALQVDETCRVFGSKPVIFVDGPVYPVPNIFKQHYNLLILKIVKKGRIDDYVASWKTLLEHRISSIYKLERQGVPVIGIVKRLESSRLMISSKDFMDKAREQYGIPIGDMGNDQALIDMLFRILVSKGFIHQPFKPMVIGPFKIPSSTTYIDKYVSISVPDKIAYYVIVPRTRFGSMLRYIVYRVESTLESIEILRDSYRVELYDAVLRDSIGSGTMLPLTILYADKRCKKLSRSIAKILAGDLEARGIPLTYDTIRVIEAYIHE